MRQRNIKNLDEKIEALSGYIIERYGGEGRDLEIEIGCGKGRFLTALAKKRPRTMFVGIEGQSNVLLRALEKAAAEELDNVKYINAFVYDLRDFFPEKSAQKIYLNFPDPWPKARHRKRRLTYRERLKTYMEVLREGGSLELRTDNGDFFGFTLEEARALGLKPADICGDLHAERAERVTTEYEERFSGEGKNIYYLRLDRT